MYFQSSLVFKINNVNDNIVHLFKSFIASLTLTCAFVPDIHFQSSLIFDSNKVTIS